MNKNAERVKQWVDEGMNSWGAPEQAMLALVKDVEDLEYRVRILLEALKEAAVIIGHPDDSMSQYIAGVIERGGRGE